MVAARIRFLVDENVPDDVAVYLRERGHEVLLVRDLLAPGVQDPVIATVADAQGAVVVTVNHKYFDKRIGRRPLEGGRMLRHAGRISLRCKETIARRRLEQNMDLVEYLWQQAQQKSDKRLIVEITTTTIQIIA